MRVAQHAGHGASALVGDDSCFPIRGQVCRVRAPWIRHYTGLDDKFYVIPKLDVVVLGGTQQRGDTEEGTRDADRAQILAAVHKLVPALQGAEMAGEWVRRACLLVPLVAPITLLGGWI